MSNAKVVHKKRAVTKKTAAKKVVAKAAKITVAKKTATPRTMPSLAEFRSKFHVKGKPLSHIVNEGRR